MLNREVNEVKERPSLEGILNSPLSTVDSRREAIRPWLYVLYADTHIGESIFAQSTRVCGCNRVSSHTE